MSVKGYYSSFESFALVDGPGVRSVLFLASCPFRCLYCHNPETWNIDESKTITSDEAFKKFVRFEPYFKNKGGITISGGEPLLQIDFLIDLFKKAKEKGYSTCIDTSGAPFSLEEPFISKFDELLKYLDLILLDIKGIDNTLHKTITGKDNSNVLAMFDYLNKKDFPIWIRYVLVPTLTDSDKVLNETKEFVNTLNNVRRFEVLAYHPFALPKYQQLGIEYKLIDIQMPTPESKAHAETVLEINKYNGYLNDKYNKKVN